jgi:hypothetical protein
MMAHLKQAKSAGDFSHYDPWLLCMQSLVPVASFKVLHTASIIQAGDHSLDDKRLSTVSQCYCSVGLSKANTALLIWASCPYQPVFAHNNMCVLSAIVTGLQRSAKRCGNRVSNSSDQPPNRVRVGQSSIITPLTMEMTSNMQHARSEFKTSCI